MPSGLTESTEHPSSRKRSLKNGTAVLQSGFMGQPSSKAATRLCSNPWETRWKLFGQDGNVLGAQKPKM